MSFRERARAAVRTALGTRDGTPWLSVVVPVYNVEDYLEACLDSILGQSFTDLEVVVVDDGSTDRSGEVCRAYAERCPRVRVVSTANRGLGAARNEGVRHARGDLLAFADSDDLVLPGAYEAMVGSLDRSGSDLVVGAMARDFARGTRMPPRQRAIHARPRSGVTVEDMPEVLADVFAWNKVFRRKFWDRVPVEFPQGTRYEDQPAMTRAYLQARAFDVLDKPVYLWRLRRDGASITGRRHEVADLRDRLATKRECLQTVRRLGSARVLDTFYKDALVMDLPARFNLVPGCGDDFWTMLRDGLRELFADGPPFWHARIPVHHRLIAWLVAADRRFDAEMVLAFAAEHLPRLPVDTSGGRCVVQLPFWDDDSSGVPRELFELRDEESAQVRQGHLRVAAPTPRLSGP